LQQHGIPNAEIDRRVNEAARILDLSNLLNRKPKELSGGQRQRVAMGRAIVRHPKAFLLDEPLSNLDAKLRVLMRAELGRLHARLGVTTIHVTHDQIEAMTLGNRIAVFSAGALQQYDTPHALYGNPVNIFVAGFIGSPAMNFLEATVIGTGDAASLSIGTSTVPLHPLPEGAHVATGDKVIVGIRPEHLLWLPAGAGSQTGLRARVELVERIEPESFVVASLTDPTIVIRAADDFVKTRADDEPELARSDARLVTMRLNADKVPDRGSSIDIVIDVGRIHLFGSRTGKNLRMAAGSPA
jgi:multiple sugar transport system ATP-binding protein